jgi:hypothetical protein
VLPSLQLPLPYIDGPVPCHATAQRPAVHLFFNWLIGHERCSGRLNASKRFTAKGDSQSFSTEANSWVDNAPVRFPPEGPKMARVSTAARLAPNACRFGGPMGVNTTNTHRLTSRKQSILARTPPRQRGTTGCLRGMDH